MKKKIVTLIAIYIVCGIYAYGTAMADLLWHADHEWPAVRLGADDLKNTCRVEAALGPAGAVVMAIVSDFNKHGWRVR